MKILRFYADWCAPCTQFSQILKEVKEKYGGNFPIQIDSVNIEENIMESIAFDIKNIPTLVMIDDKRNEIKRSVGVMTVEQTMAWMDDTSAPSKSEVKPKATAKKTPAKKAPAKKVAEKKPAAKKAPAKKVAPKTKAPAKKVTKPKADK
jgi:thioredoxin-like negative regulator of GroEL